MSRIQSNEIVVTVQHPYGRVDMSLEKWIRIGPGDRELLRPVAVKSRLADRPLPLKVIPFRYRNNTLSRALIRIGFLTNPWKSGNSQDNK